MSHALVNSVLQLGIARSSLESANPATSPPPTKQMPEWFPQKERSFSFGIFNCGANVGVILATLLVPLATYFLAGTPPFWSRLFLRHRGYWCGIFQVP